MTEVETLINEPSEAEKRIKQLSDKVKTTAEERDAAIQLQAESDAKAVEAEKRAAFSEAFSDIVANNPAAKDFKADIQAKVMSGYSPEDAAFAVLGKAGKLSNQAQSEPDGPVAGGSATTNAQPKTPSISEMSQEEKRKILSENLSFN